jgi:hypothetical protein
MKIHIVSGGPGARSAMRYRAALHPERFANLIISLKLQDDRKQIILHGSDDKYYKP